MNHQLSVALRKSWYRRYWVVPLVVIGVLASLCPAGLSAQIFVDSDTAQGPNHLTSHAGPFLPPTPESGDMTNTGDLFIARDLEIADQVYLDGVLYMRREPSPVDFDQIIFFSNNSTRDEEFLRWREQFEAFAFSDDLDLSNVSGANYPEVRITARFDNELQLFSEAPEMRFLIDSNADDDASVLSHIFTWSNNNLNANQRAMILQSNTGSVGNLVIAGALTETFSFDLAEAFWATGAVEAGDLVAIDPSRPDAVVLATAAAAKRLLGVVSSRPGILMGGGALSADALRANWGEETATLFFSEREDLEAEFLRTNPVLLEEARILESETRFAQSTLARQTARMEAGTDSAVGSDNDGIAQPKSAKLPAAEQLASAYRDALVKFETRLFDGAMRSFFERHFVAVALAGRVPVKVDASFGGIAIGDPLTVSPASGVAMRAVETGPVVGTALESMSSGSGTIMMMVHKGWIGSASGGTSLLAATDLARPAIEEKLELDALRLELEEIRGLVRSLQGSAELTMLSERVER